MNARPYIFGCLCLVGATGTAAAADIDLTTLLSLGGASMSSSFEGAGSSRSSGGGRDTATGADVMSTRPGSASPRATTNAAPSSAPADTDDTNHEDPASLRSQAPSWQSMLPGSML